MMLLASSLMCCNSIFAQQETAENQENGEMLRYRKFTYVDQQGTGIEAFSFLMPSDWKFEGGMQWILDNPVMPAITAFRVFNPVGREQFEVFPNHCYFWTSNPQQLILSPPGSRYFGSIVMQPMPAEEALVNIILPEFRNGFQGLNVVFHEDLPELPIALGAGNMGEGYVSSAATGAKMRVSYIRDEIPMEEEFYAVVETITFPIQSMYGTFYNTIWYIDYIFSFKAEKGKLESNTKPFQAITSSFKLNPAWYAKYSNVIEYMAQQQITQIRSIGEFSRLLSRMSDQMSEQNLQQFYARGEVYDKVAQKFSDNTLGIDRYYDPFEEREVELPSGYNHAWSNNNGEYILIDDPNFNPNVGSNLHWEPLQRK
jgi:hypothetical protein